MDNRPCTPVCLTQNPIFVVGYPRSGTTLIQRLLATQRGIVSFPETHYFGGVEKHVQTDGNGCIVPSSLWVMLDAVREKMGFEFAEEERRDLQQLAADRRLSSRDFFEYAVKHFLKTLYPERDLLHEPFRWVEKTPTHAMFIDRILEFYPRAQVLHILRHPVPAILSRKHKFPFNHETPLEELARRWNRMQDRVEQFRRQYGAHIHVMRYEDLMADMERELKAAAGFLNISFDFSLLQGIKPLEDARRFVLARETWKQDDIERDIASTNDTYRGNTSHEQVAAIEKIVSKTMHRYGYRPFLEEFPRP
jgi:hypothetical protein